MEYFSLSGILLSCVILFLLYIYQERLPWKRLPPGPVSFPVIGTLPFLGGDIRDVFAKMAAKYGDVFTVYMGPQRTVVLNGYDVIKDCWLKSSGVFDRRSDLWKDIKFNMGIASASGEFWKEQRRHFQHFLRTTYSQRNCSMEDMITSEASHLVAALRSKAGSICSIEREIMTSVANIVTTMVMEKRFECGDEELDKFLAMIDLATGAIGPDNLSLSFPLLRYIPGDPFRFHMARNGIGYQTSAIGGWIKRHQQLPVEDQSENNVIGHYLKEIKARSGDVNTTFTERQLKHLIQDMFGAGIDTTTYALLWTMVYVIRNPDIQARVHSEIDCVLGRDTPPSMQDRKNLPYTEAVISEAQRMCDILPMGVPHSAAEDTVIKGYNIPKGTMLIANLHSIHHDPRLWPDPERFDPGRFLDEDGRYRKREELVPFSIGKRACVGENVARMELFLFFTHIMQTFNFIVPENHPPPSTEGILGLSFRTKPFTVRVELRS